MRNKNPLFSALRVMPSFIFLAISGCLFGYFVLHESLDRLAVDVAVPVISMFLLTRVMILIVPHDKTPPPRGRKSVIYPLRVVSALIFFGGFVGSILLLSAALYRMVGFDGASHTALHWAAYCIGEATAVFLFFVAAAWITRQIGSRVLVLCFRLVHIFWRVLWAPGQLTTALLGNHGSPLTD